MITCKNGNVQINGMGLEILFETAMIIRSVADNFKGDGFESYFMQNIMKDICSMAIEAGFSDDEEAFGKILSREIEKLQHSNPHNDDLDDMADDMLRDILGE